MEIELKYLPHMVAVVRYRDGCQRSRNVDREMTHRFRMQKDCGAAIGDFFPHVFPLRPDQVFSVMFGGAHNRAEFAFATA